LRDVKVHFPSIDLLSFVVCPIEDLLFILRLLIVLLQSSVYILIEKLDDVLDLCVLEEISGSDSRLSTDINAAAVLKQQDSCAIFMIELTSIVEWSEAVIIEEIKVEQVSELKILPLLPLKVDNVVVIFSEAVSSEQFFKLIHPKSLVFTEVILLSDWVSNFSLVDN